MRPGNTMTRRGIAIEFANRFNLATQPGFTQGELILYRTNEMPVIVPFAASGLPDHMAFLGYVATWLGSDRDGFPMFFGDCLAHLPDGSFDWTLAAMLSALETKR